MSASEVHTQLMAAFESGIVDEHQQVSFSVELPTGEIIEHDAEEAIEAGSAMKTLFLARICQLVTSGEMAADCVFVVHSDDRVPASDIFEGIADGAEVSLPDVLMAMMGASDNTATQIIQQAIDMQAVTPMLATLGMRNTPLPGFVRDIYYSLNDPDQRFPAFRTTMRDMRLCYRHLLDNRLSFDDVGNDLFWRSLAAEDERQGTDWGVGIRFFRKSGSVIWDSVNAQSFCGIARRGSVSVPFAFALNRRPGGDELAAETFEAFAPQFGGAAKSLLGYLAEP